MREPVRSADARQRTLERLRRLACEGLDVAAFLDRAGAALDRVVPSDVDTLPSPTWMTVDPASRLLTSTYTVGCEMSTEEIVAFEYVSSDPGNRVSDVLGDPRGVRTSTELLQREPSTARHYRALLASMGVEHEVLIALRGTDGVAWGAGYLVRAPGRAAFDDQDLAFLRTAAPLLADGVRRGLVHGEADGPEGPRAPAIVVLDERLEPEWRTPGADDWLADLGGGGHGELPTPVLSVAQAALARDGSTPVAGPDPGDEAPVEGRVAAPSADGLAVRVRAPRRGWVTLHGQPLTGGPPRRVAVTIQAAATDRISTLLLATHGLTAREAEVARHVLHGRSTAQIATALGVSPYTVQEHLKHIFEKTGVRSRRQLVAGLFARHYRSRVDDNEHRVSANRPIRGGPYPDT